MPIMPKKDDGSVDWESGIRTGAYMLEKFDARRHRHLHQERELLQADKGWFDRVEFLSIKDVAARTNALLSGEIQYMDRCDLKTLDHAEAEPGHHRLRDHRLWPLHLRDERDAEALRQSSNVRIAIKYSINRDDMLEKVFLGHGTVGNDNPIAPTVKFAVDPQPRHVYDPDKAKELLKKAGLDS